MRFDTRLLKPELITTSQNQTKTKEVYHHTYNELISARTHLFSTPRTKNKSLSIPDITINSIWTPLLQPSQFYPHPNK